MGGGGGGGEGGDWHLLGFGFEGRGDAGGPSLARRGVEWTCLDGDTRVLQLCSLSAKMAQAGADGGEVLLGLKKVLVPFFILLLLSRPWLRSMLRMLPVLLVVTLEARLPPSTGKYDRTALLLLRVDPRRSRARMNLAMPEVKRTTPPTPRPSVSGAPPPAPPIGSLMMPQPTLRTPTRFSWRSVCTKNRSSGLSCALAELRRPDHPSFPCSAWAWVRDLQPLRSGSNQRIKVL